MPYDPYGYLANSNPYLAGMQQRAPSALPPMSPEEEDTWLSKVTGKALGGLQWLGGTLDKTFGGRAIRGVLGGKPEELLSIIPGSDTFGLTDERNRVTGEDLLSNLGIVDKNSWAGTLGGIGAEIALDPATYLSFGAGAVAKGSLGAAAKAGGYLPAKMAERIAGFAATSPEAAKLAAAVGKPIAEVAGKPLSGLAGIGLPFMEPIASIGTGPGSLKAAELLGAVGDKIRYSAPVRAAFQGFDNSMSLLRSTEAQKLAPKAYEGIREATAQGRGKLFDAMEGLREAKVLDNPNQIYRWVEGVDHVPSEVAPHIDALKGAIDAGKEALLDQGVNVKEFTSPHGTEHFPGYAAGLAKETAGYKTPFSERALPTGHPSLQGREEIFDIPGGRAKMNEMVKDDRLSGKSGASLADRQRIIESDYLGIRGGPNNVTGPQAEQSAGLAGWVFSRDPQYVEKQLDYFAHPVDNAFKYAEHAERASGNANLLTDVVAKVARPLGTDPSDVPLLKTLTDAGLTFNEKDAAGNYVRGAIKQVQDKLAKAADSGLALPGWKSGVTGDIKTIGIPAEHYKDLTRSMQAFTTPEILQPVVGALDYITNLTKAFQTSLWPAFHVRNWMSGLYMNWLKDAGDPRFHALDPLGRRWAQPIIDANAISKGGTIAGASEMPMFKALGLNDEQATQQVRKLMFMYKVAGGGVSNITNEISGAASLPGALKQVIGGRKSVYETLKEGIPEIGDKSQPFMQRFEQIIPTNVRGAGANENIFAPTRAGAELGGKVEDLNRGSQFIGYLRQGMDPAEAAKQVRMTHFDYTELTGVEKQVMRRLAPFYTWNKKNAAVMMGEIMQRPGGKLGATVRATNELPGSDSFTPEYLGQGLAVPVGSEQNGNQRFLSSLGLPFEAAAQSFQFGPGGPGRTTEKLLSQTNPLIKGPLEMLAGRQFYSGRNLDELYGPTGYTPADQLIMNSPLSRPYTTARSLLDPRKYESAGAAAALPLNLLTGVRLTDVDMEKQRNLAARDILDQMLSSNPNIDKFSTLYVKPEDIAKLSPEERDLMRLYQALRAKKKGAGP